LDVELDAPLPRRIAVGSGTALFIHGTCFHPERAIRSLAFRVDGGDEQPVYAYGMPRLDYFRALHPGLDPFATANVSLDSESEEDPMLHSYRSGFWGLAQIAPARPGAGMDVRLRASFEGGSEDETALGRIEVSAPPEPMAVQWPVAEGQPRVVICMAAYEPPLELLRRQIDSIRAQTHENWVCVISDDCSRPERFEAITGVIGSDPRFVVSPSERHLGFYLNFERALSLAPPDCDLVALSDQDDYWYPEKLAVLSKAIGKAQLVYSDARIIGRGGEEIAASYWGARRNNHRDLTSLLVANSVTGAASLLRREVLDYALPFPPRQFAHYHDHWLGLTALALGEIEYVDQPLYDYVQHRSAALGHAAANRITPLWNRLHRVRDDPRERVRVARTRYFVDVMRLRAFATILELRCGERMGAERRRALNRFVGLERSWSGLAWFGARAARELMRDRPETLGAEWELLQALLWRRLLSATARDRPAPRMRLDALPPADLAPDAATPPVQVEGARHMAEKIAPLALAVSESAPPRVNVLIPTIDLEHFFGGYIAKFNLARRLAERGARVRLVTVDPVGPLPRDWRDRIQSFSGLGGMFERVEVAFGRSGGPLEVSRTDGFVASTWWTAHVAHAALQQLDGRSLEDGGGFVYLVQEYEPFTFEMGSWGALAEQSYRFPHFALFSSELLREYFRRRRLGVYGRGAAAGDGRSASFQNAITAVAAPDRVTLATRTTRRLLFYARPEPHAARNLFELGVLAIRRALEDGAFVGGWELRGIGAQGPSRRIGLQPGVDLDLLPRTAQGDYAQLLAEHDVGLALMYTPHPSLVPIEMAGAGLLTVTNTFENKTAEALLAISSNLLAAEPTIEGVAAALGEAAAAADDAERRVRGSDVRWSRDWATSFDEELLARLESFLSCA
jgi:glycosyltransferase involved in cell wall biosynthesis